MHYGRDELGRSFMCRGVSLSFSLARTRQGLTTLEPRPNAFCDFVPKTRNLRDSNSAVRQKMSIFLRACTHKSILAQKVARLSYELEYVLES